MTKFNVSIDDNVDDNFDATRDVGSKREYPFGKNKVIAERKDPYGLWYLRFDSGPIPASLQGSFTGLSYAENAINSYFATKKLEASVKDATPVK